jgi:hypothetical protein
MVFSCDNDSEFDFRWNGPSSLLDWACKAILFIIYSCMTVVEILFCGRWRDFWPLRKADGEVDVGKAPQNESNT